MFPPSLVISVKIVFILAIVFLISLILCGFSKNIAKVGDTVRLLSTRPLSKTKRYELVEVLVESVEA